MNSSLGGSGFCHQIWKIFTFLLIIDGELLASVNNLRPRVKNCNYEAGSSGIKGTLKPPLVSPMQTHNRFSRNRKQ